MLLHYDDGEEETIDLGKEEWKLNKREGEEQSGGGKRRRILESEEEFDMDEESEGGDDDDDDSFKVSAFVLFLCIVISYIFGIKLIGIILGFISHNFSFNAIINAS